MTSRSRRARTRLLAAVAAAVATFAVVVGGAYLIGRPDGQPATRPTPVAESLPADEPEPQDPYEVYLKLAPEGAPELSREDAQARAYLGCGKRWAPGTVDAALAKAYADLCEDR